MWKWCDFIFGNSCYGRSHRFSYDHRSKHLKVDEANWCWCFGVKNKFIIPSPPTAGLSSRKNSLVFCVVSQLWRLHAEDCGVGPTVESITPGPELGWKMAEEKLEIVNGYWGAVTVWVLEDIQLPPWVWLFITWLCPRVIEKKESVFYTLSSVLF